MAANSSFTTALLSFGFFNYICLGIYKSAIYFISIFFFASAFIFLKNFFLCLVFLFIHYSSVTSYLDLVAWFLNSLGELNLFQKFKNLIFLGELNLYQKSEFHVNFFLLYNISLFFWWRMFVRMTRSLLDHSILLFAIFYTISIFVHVPEVQFFEYSIRLLIFSRPLSRICEMGKRLFV